MGEGEAAVTLNNLRRLVLGLMLVCSVVTLFLIGKPAIVPFAFVLCACRVQDLMLVFLPASPCLQQG